MVDTWTLSIFVAFAVTFALLVWGATHSLKVERRREYGCILLSDCTRTQFCKKDGRKYCWMRPWRKAPKVSRVAWCLMLPWFIFSGLGIQHLRPSILKARAREWLMGFPTKQEMREPIKRGVQL